MFSVEPQSTMSSSVVQLLVKKPEMVDFEKIQQMILQVRKLGHDFDIKQYHISEF